MMWTNFSLLISTEFIKLFILSTVTACNLQVIFILSFGTFHFFHFNVWWNGCRLNSNRLDHYWLNRLNRLNRCECLWLHLVGLRSQQRIASIIHGANLSWFLANCTRSTPKYSATILKHFEKTLKKPKLTSAATTGDSIRCPDFSANKCSRYT